MFFFIAQWLVDSQQGYGDPMVVQESYEYFSSVECKWMNVVEQIVTLSVARSSLVPNEALT